MVEQNSSPHHSDFLFMLGGIGCFFSSAITLLVCWYISSLPPLLIHQTHQVFFPRSVTTEMGYQVKPQSPTPNSRSSSNYTFTQPTSPKSPTNFVQYHQRYREEYPPIEVDRRFSRRRSRSRTRRDRNVRSLDFEVGAREDTASTSSKAPSYHQYPEEEYWEDRGRWRQWEREYPKADVEAASETSDGDAPQLPMAVLGTGPGRGEMASTAPRPTTNLHPYVCCLISHTSLRIDLYNFRSPLLRLPLVSYTRITSNPLMLNMIDFVDLVDLTKITRNPCEQPPHAQFQC